MEKIKGTKAHTRYATEDGIIVPGVTTITGLLNKPALVAWANKLGLQGIDSTKYVDVTAQIGTCAHHMIECDLQGIEPSLDEYSPDVVDKAENSLIKYWEWKKSNEIEPIFIEGKFVSEKYLYGGTLDLYCKLNGKKTLVDLKSSKAIWEEFFYQLAGYNNLLEEQDHFPEEYRILRFGRDESEGHEEMVLGREALKTYWEIFYHLLQVYHLKKKGALA